MSDITFLAICTAALFVIVLMLLGVVDKMKSDLRTTQLELGTVQKLLEVWRKP